MIENGVWENGWVLCRSTDLVSFECERGGLVGLRLIALTAKKLLTENIVSSNFTQKLKFWFVGL